MPGGNPKPGGGPIGGFIDGLFVAVVVNPDG